MVYQNLYGDDFSALSLNSSECSCVGLLFTNEEQEKVGSRYI